MQGKAHIYINGTAAISPQRTFDGSFLADTVNYTNNVLTCVTPDFKAYISAVHLRRLSRMLRIGLTTSIICLREAAVDVPDGIITATGYGFLEETEKFLREVLDRNEKQLTPTFFMQGTYNALAGLIGLSLKCTGYNNTYVSKGFALGSALNDATVQLQDEPEKRLLVGTYDESAAVQYTTGMRAGHFKTESVDSLKLYSYNTPGSIQGEGSAFFLLSGMRSATTLCRLMAVQGLFCPTPAELATSLQGFLERNDISATDLDLWIAGHSGDVERDTAIGTLADDVLARVPQARFKHLTGEYCTADGFALWLGATILKRQSIPAAVVVKAAAQSHRIGHLLIVNHYLGRNYTFYLLQRAG